MKKIAVMAGLILAASFGKAQEALTISLSDPSKPANISLSLVNGSIEVSSHGGKEVLISVPDDSKPTAYKPVKREDGLTRINTNRGFDLQAVEENNNVRITSSSPHQKITVKILVPINTNLKISTVNNGTLKVEKVSGSIEAKNVNGSIYMNDINGTVSANTINGNVQVNFTRIDKNPMAFTTLNGNVELGLPASAAVQFKMKSDRGDIYSDFDIKLEASTSKASITTEDGMKKISKDGYTVGSINGGGPEFFLKNMNGDLIIRKK